MKAIKLFTMAALATAVFASCSNDEDLAQSSYPADNVVRVTTNVEDITTRAFHTTNTLDEFAFCIRNANNIKYSYNNIMMTKRELNGILLILLFRCFGRTQLSLSISWLMPHSTQEEIRNQ